MLEIVPTSILIIFSYEMHTGASEMFEDREANECHIDHENTAQNGFQVELFFGKLLLNMLSSTL